MYQQRFTTCAYIVGLLVLPATIAAYGDHVAAMPSVTSMAAMFQRSEAETLPVVDSSPQYWTRSSQR